MESCISHLLCAVLITGAALHLAYGCRPERGQADPLPSGECREGEAMDGSGCCLRCFYCRRGMRKQQPGECLSPCVRCDPGTFSDGILNEVCQRCRDCGDLHRTTNSTCTATRNAQCGGCLQGYYIESKEKSECIIYKASRHPERQAARDNSAIVSDHGTTNVATKSTDPQPKCQPEDKQYPPWADGSCGPGLGENEAGCCVPCTQCDPGLWKQQPHRCLDPCVPCQERYYSTQLENQLCAPCTNCTRKQRETEVPCNSRLDARCGACLPGFYENPDPEGSVDTQDQPDCVQCQCSSSSHPQCSDYCTALKDNQNQHLTDTDGRKLVIIGGVTFALSLMIIFVIVVQRSYVKVSKCTSRPYREEGADSPERRPLDSGGSQGQDTMTLESELRSNPPSEPCPHTDLLRESNHNNTTHGHDEVSSQNIRHSPDIYHRAHGYDEHSPSWLRSSPDQTDTKA